MLALWIRRGTDAAARLQPTARLLHTAPRRARPKEEHANVYKTLGFASKLTAEEGTAVIEKINSCLSAEDLEAAGVPKGRSPHIHRHMERFGKFQCVEQLLDVDGYDAKKLHRTAKSVLKATGGADSSSSSKAVAASVKKDRNRLLKQIKPRIPPEDFESQVTSVVGIKFSLNTLSFAHIDKSRKVLAWNALENFDSDEDSRQKAVFEHPNMYHSAFRVASELPADSGTVYVVENNAHVKEKDPNLAAKLLQFQFQHYITALLNRAGPENRVYFVGSSVSANLFGLMVGSERVATHHRLTEILSPNRWDNPFGTWIPSEIFDDAFRNDSRVVVKEQLASALLVAIAFNHIFSTSGGSGISANTSDSL